MVARSGFEIAPANPRQQSVFPEITSAEDAELWARQDFANLQLGHAARNKRALQIAQGVLRRPAGAVTHVFTAEADSHAAYRWLHNPAVRPDLLLDSMALGALARAGDDTDLMIVANDFTSLNFSDPSRRKPLGPIHNKQIAHLRGLHVMDSLLMTPRGVPLGIVDLQFWARHDDPGRPHRRKASERERAAQRRQPFEEKETYYWRLAAERTTHRLNARPYQLWFQWDRGADAHEVLDFIGSFEQYFTIRLCQDRNVSSHRKILKTIKSSLAVKGKRATGRLKIARSGHQRGRIANVEISWSRFDVALRRHGSKTPYAVREYSVVRCRETDAGESVKDPLDWWLITNRKVETAAEALEVIEKYSYRWRDEEFHRGWKSLCGVEKSGLRKIKALECWSCLLGSVAVRAERLKLLSREEPEALASDALSEAELKALVTLAKPKKYKEGEEITMGQAVLWLARLGGYYSTSTPPGAQVISRGLARIEPLVAILSEFDLVPKERSRKKTGQ